MMHHYENTLEAMARQLLETLQRHGKVTLEITSDGEEVQALLRVITELHILATRDRLRIRLTQLGERGLRFQLEQAGEP